MSVSISHKGIITAVGKDTITVAISPSDEDCDGCAISKLCTKKESLDVFYSNPDKDLVGKSATIEISQSSQTKAVILMLAVPIFIMVAAMLISVRCGLSELLSVLISLACMALWYLGVYIISNSGFSRHHVSVARIDTLP